jgi:hypothetical protein
MAWPERGQGQDYGPGRAWRRRRRRRKSRRRTRHGGPTPLRGGGELRICTPLQTGRVPLSTLRARTSRLLRGHSPRASEQQRGQALRQEAHSQLLTLRQTIRQDLFLSLSRTRTLPLTLPATTLIPPSPSLDPAPHSPPQIPPSITHLCLRLRLSLLFFLPLPLPLSLHLERERAPICQQGTSRHCPCPTPIHHLSDILVEG